jgi:hypothetical protein
LNRSFDWYGFKTAEWRHDTEQLKNATLGIITISVMLKVVMLGVEAPNSARSFRQFAASSSA